MDDKTIESLASGEPDPHEGASDDNLDHVTQTMIDAVLGAYVAGAMHEGDAVRIMKRLGMDGGEAIELLDAERLEASQP